MAYVSAIRAIRDTRPISLTMAGVPDVIGDIIRISSALWLACTRLDSGREEDSGGDSDVERFAVAFARDGERGVGERAKLRAAIVAARKRLEDGKSRSDL